MKKLFIVLFAVFPLLPACSSDDDILYEDSICDLVTIVDGIRFKNTKSQGFIIRNAKVSGDCLEIEIESGGCDGSRWEVALIDGAYVAESLPPQRGLKIAFQNNEECFAVVRKTYTFDLRPVQIPNSDVIFLRLEHWGNSVLYEY